jgi:leucyl-tRNA synthetase
MITRDGTKMSKSRGNVISPREYVERFGADTARAYILFIGPPDQDADWSDSGVAGVHRFLTKLWRVAQSLDPAGAEGLAVPAGPPHALVRKAHWAIDRVSNALQERFAFNTAIAAVMELVNAIADARAELAESPDGRSQLRWAVATAASLVFPFAPHLGAEVYERLTGRRVWDEPWPEADPALLKGDTFELVVQVNGKLRDRIATPAGASPDEQENLARASERVAAQLNGGQIVKAIVVPGKLVNLVVR